MLTYLRKPEKVPEFDARLIQVIPENLQKIAELTCEIDSYASSVRATWNNGYLRTVHVPIIGATPWDYVPHKYWLLLKNGERGFRVFEDCPSAVKGYVAIGGPVE